MANFPLAESLGNGVIALAADGKRFMNENTSPAYAANALSNVVGDRIFYVWDSAYAYAHETWPGFGNSIDGSNGIVPGTPEEQLASWESSYLKADTLESYQVKYYDLTCGNVIKGWQDCLQHMHIGDSWLILVPWYLAYGQSGSGTIKPYTNLFFRLELVDITSLGDNIEHK